MITGLYLSNTSSKAKVMIEVLPSAFSSKPISGVLSTAKGIFVGAVKGAANGILYKDWGHNAIVMGIKEVSIENQDGRSVWWVEKVFEGLEFERDLDLVKKVGKKVYKKTSDINDGVHILIMKVMEESNCPIM